MQITLTSFLVATQHITRHW